MRRVKILSRKEIKRVLKLLDEQYGCNELPEYVFMQNQKAKLHVVKKEAFNIPDDKVRIDSLGIYFGVIERDEIRLSIEGSQILGPKSTKNILEIDDMIPWMEGRDISVDTELTGLVIIRHGKDFLGCGRVKDGTLLNYYPKSRRINK